LRLRKTPEPPPNGLAEVHDLSVDHCGGALEAKRVPFEPSNVYDDRMLSELVELLDYSGHMFVAAVADNQRWDQSLSKRSQWSRSSWSLSRVSFVRVSAVSPRADSLASSASTEYNETPIRTSSGAFGVLDKPEAIG
jgi:hypothetical protein